MTDNPLIEIIEHKEKLRRALEELLSPQERREALRDHHARRRPRPCGMTIHTGIGCTLRCTYCYIEDMGFKWNVTLYPLTGIQLVYALVSNPYFVPGENGTLIAIGSVTEPFLPQTKEKAFEYIEAISKHLGNPIQFSTKMALTLEDARRLKQSEPGISPLVTIITIKHHRKLEPYAPPPSMRFETIKNLAQAGLKPILFLRPIIPGVTEHEYTELLERARRSGAIGVVAGSLRVTPLILSRLRNAGIPVDEIMRRLPRMPRKHEQVTLHTGDVKRRILDYAIKIGLLPFPEACMANIYTHEAVCWKMKYLNPRLFSAQLSEPDENIIVEAAKHLGLRVNNVKRHGFNLMISLEGRREDKVFFLELVKCYYKICPRITK